MKLALHTLMWAWEPLEEVFGYAQELGVLRLDLGALPGGCGHLHLPASGDLASRCQKLLDLLPPDAGYVAVTADHPGLSAAEPAAREAAIEYTLEAMQAAERLGAPVVGTSLGSVGEGRDWTSAAACAEATLREVFKRSPEGISLAIELHANDVCNSPAKAEHFIRGVDHPRLGVTLDTSLLFHNRIGIDDAFDRLGERLFHVHLRGATHETYFAIPGRDEVDFERFFGRLRETSYAGALSLELYEVKERYGISTLEALREAIPYLREVSGGAI